MRTYKKLNSFLTSIAITSLLALPALGAENSTTLSMTPPKPPTAATVTVTPPKMLKKLTKQKQQKNTKSEQSNPELDSTAIEKVQRDPAASQNKTGHTAKLQRATKSSRLHTRHHASGSPAKRIHANSSKTVPLVETFLEEGKLAEGERELSAQLEQNPSDDNLRFGLGIVQFLGAVQKLSQDLYRYGLRDPADHDLRLPFLRLEIPSNPNPETLTYSKARTMMDDLNKKLLQSAETLDAIKDPNVKVPLHFGLIKLDLDGDGKVGEGETLWKIYSHITRNSHIKPELAEQFTIGFDRGDVHWLKGYCHLLSSFCEIYLAHDTREMFERTAHVFFRDVDSPYKFLKNGKHIFRIRSSDVDIVDVVALIHLINWDVVEPQRMEAALHDWEEVVRQSRISWRFIMSETDNDREWLPNPKQDCVIPNLKVSNEMVQSWGSIMDELDLVLKGERLIPFWRSPEFANDSERSAKELITRAAPLTGTGLNVRKVFMEPRKLDLVMWVQGTGAAPFLETGRLTQGNDWNKWRSVFGDNFPGFALFFN